MEENEARRLELPLQLTQDALGRSPREEAVTPRACMLAFLAMLALRAMIFTASLFIAAKVAGVRAGTAAFIAVLDVCRLGGDAYNVAMDFDA